MSNTLQLILGCIGIGVAAAGFWNIRHDLAAEWRKRRHE